MPRKINGNRQHPAAKCRPACGRTSSCAFCSRWRILDTVRRWATERRQLASNVLVTHRPAGELFGSIDRTVGPDAPAEQKAQETFDRTLPDFAPGAVDCRDLPRHHPVRRGADRALDPAAVAADHGGDARDRLGQLRSQRAGTAAKGRGRRDGAGGRSVPRKRIAKRKTRTNCGPSKEKAEARCSNSKLRSRT